MDFKDSIFQLAERVSALKESIQTEEATKNAFIMPFIQILGYDVFNPLEVVPEMDCDITKKKGEKIDYAIMKDGVPVMLIECKHWKQDLNLHDNQLKRYFVASKAKFGVLTNGIVYRFYTDLIKENIMDDVPFLEINLEKIRETQIEEVKKFCKGVFDGFPSPWKSATYRRRFSVRNKRETKCTKIVPKSFLGDKGTNFLRNHQKFVEKYNFMLSFPSRNVKNENFELSNVS